MTFVLSRSQTLHRLQSTKLYRIPTSFRYLRLFYFFVKEILNNNILNTRSRWTITVLWHKVYTLHMFLQKSRYTFVSWCQICLKIHFWYSAVKSYLFANNWIKIETYEIRPYICTYNVFFLDTETKWEILNIRRGTTLKLSNKFKWN